MAKKKLLIYAHYYIPDTASTGQILRELAEGMLDKFDITVICVVPSYLGTIEDKYKTQKYYEEEINGVKVLRIRVPEFSKTNKKSRVKNIVSYFFGGFGTAVKMAGKIAKWGWLIVPFPYDIVTGVVSFFISIMVFIGLPIIPIRKAYKEQMMDAETVE